MTKNGRLGRAADFSICPWHLLPSRVVRSVSWYEQKLDISIGENTRKLWIKPPANSELNRITARGRDLPTWLFLTQAWHLS